MKSVEIFIFVCKYSLSKYACVRNVNLWIVLCLQAFVCLCDVLMVFGSLSEGEGSALQCYSPDESLTAEMASFLIDHVFTDSDDDLYGTSQQTSYVNKHLYTLLHTSIHW